MISIIRKFLRKIFNFAYGFNIEILDPDKEVNVYFYHRNRYTPIYATDGAVAADISADLGEYDKITVNPNETYLLKTGLHLELPHNYGALLYSRSGLSKEEILFLNGVGVIDFDYRGQIHFPIKNIGDKPVVIKDGQRIGQIMITRISKANFIEVDSLSYLSGTKRGDGGFGHTGKM